MYVYIFEDGTTRSGTTFDEGDKEACDAGILEVLDVTGEVPLTWYKGEWHKLESAD